MSERHGNIATAIPDVTNPMGVVRGLASSLERNYANASDKASRGSFAGARMQVDRFQQFADGKVQEKKKRAEKKAKDHEKRKKAHAKAAKQKASSAKRQASVAKREGSGSSVKPKKSTGISTKKTSAGVQTSKKSRKTRGASSGGGGSAVAKKPAGRKVTTPKAKAGIKRGNIPDGSGVTHRGPKGGTYRMVNGRKDYGGVRGKKK